ncbi:MAG: glutamine--tRNA ligase/YqeY domain fusion protein [Planctomycetes bacterium]|nr:glutamine--tRNA ligase/YqeY domain fusion protein [Planctomycetota bacterium]
MDGRTPRGEVTPWRRPDPRSETVDPSQDKSADASRPSHFIREMIEADLAAGRHVQIVTRFPPEPNGWLHIGHAKAICLNFGLAQEFGGSCHLRFDDTNPEKEEQSYVEAIERDVQWLGWQWTGPVRYASDYFEFMYEYAVGLVKAGKAYVDGSSVEEIRKGRGTVYEPGTPSADRDRPIAENLELFARMRKGEFPDGTCVLRAKIDMAHPNMLMRDPLLYRIRHAHHYRTGDDWCIYPMYDFAHCLEDAYEGITHSLCSLEFENNRPLYDWVLDNGAPPSRPRQTEFARLKLGYTVMSKRNLLRLVKEGHVDGWDDPRMPTLAGMRRRGVTPEAIRAFCELVGVAKTDSLVDVGKLEYCIRDDLNTRAERRMGVLHPLKLTITDWPAGKVDVLDAPSWPDDVGKPGTRKVPFDGELLVERDDFDEHPKKGWHRLAPGREVRLRYGYLVTVQEVVKDASGEVVELRCTHDPASRGGNAPDGRRVPGTIHWVSAAHALSATVRLYDRLFAVERPGTTEGVDQLDELNPESLVEVSGARLEPSLKGAQPGTRVQLERLGFFVFDVKHSRAGAPVLNRIVTLHDGWAKKVAAMHAPAGAAQAAAKDDVVPAPMPQPAASDKAPSHARDEVRASDAELAKRFARYRDALGVSAADADVLSGERALSDFFEAARDAHAEPSVVGRWIVNELLGRVGERALDDLPFEPAAFARLVALVERGTITAAAGKDVLAVMVAEGGEPSQIVSSRGLQQVSDTDALQESVRDVLAAHPDELARYRGGEQKLFAFFMGQLMKATRGKADPKLSQVVLREALKER